jgi:(2Fe-2S) ferredoxin
MFRKHVFVCTDGKTCPNQGSQEVLAELRRGLSTNPDQYAGTRINKAGCLAQCGNGPMVVVYPEGVWYCQVTAADCKEIIDEHLGKNEVVERLRYGSQQA